MVSFLLVMIGLSAGFSCHTVIEGPLVGGVTKIYHESFITGYIDKEDFSIANHIYSNSTQFYFICKVSGETHLSGSDKFKEYSEFYGDSAFNNYKYSIEPNFKDIEDICTTGSLYNIKIICDKNFDSALAGSILNDLFEYRAFSYSHLLKNNYKDLYGGLIAKPLSNISADDCILLKDGYFHLVYRSETLLNPDAYTFTVSFEDETGEVFEAKSTIIVR